MNDFATKADLAQAEDRVYRAIDTRIERAEIHLGGLITKLCNEAVTRNERLNAENIRLSQELSDLQKDIVTNGAGIRVAEALADAAVRQSAVASADAAVLRATVENWATTQATKTFASEAPGIERRAKRATRGPMWLSAVAALVTALTAVYAVHKGASAQATQATHHGSP